MVSHAFTPSTQEADLQSKFQDKQRKKTNINQSGELQRKSVCLLFPVGCRNKPSCVFKNYTGNCCSLWNARTHSSHPLPPDLKILGSSKGEEKGSPQDPKTYLLQRDKGQEIRNKDKS